jgi:hypothetical protein
MQMSDIEYNTYMNCINNVTSKKTRLQTLHKLFEEGKLKWE